MKNAAVMFLFMSLLLVACDENKSEGIPEETGKSCTSSQYQRHCDGNYLLSCDVNSVRADNCSELVENGVCATFKEAIASVSVDCIDELCSDMTVASSAGCVSKDKACSQEGESLATCETMTNGISHIRKYICTKTEEGHLYYRRTESEKCHEGYGTCSSSGECKPPIECDYKTHCDNDILYRCDDGKTRIDRCSEHPEKHICVGDGDSASCEPVSDKCINEGDVFIYSCSNNKEFIKECVKAPDGRLYYENMGSRFCSDGCNSAGTACTAYACEVGETQDVCRMTASAAYVDHFTCQKNLDGIYVMTFDNTEICKSGVCSNDAGCTTVVPCEKSDFIDYCSDNTALYCSGGITKIKRCDMDSGVCDIVDGSADCFSDKDECDNEFELTPYSCNAVSSKEFVRMCKRSDLGKLYWVNSGDRACENGCNEDGTACAAVSCEAGQAYDVCRKASSTAVLDHFTCQNEDGKYVYKLSGSEECSSGACSSDKTTCKVNTDCSTNGFSSHCEGNIAYTCPTKTVREKDCSESSATCEVVNGVAGCYKTSDVCTEVAKVEKTCSLNTSKITTKTCTKSDSNNLYWVSESENCANGCNIEGTACEMTPCRLNDKHDVCSMKKTSAYIEHYVCVSNDDGTKWSKEGYDTCEDGVCSSDGKCVTAEPCVSKEYNTHCEDNIAYRCISSKVKQYRCDYDGTVCKVEDSIAKCVDSE